MRHDIGLKWAILFLFGISSGIAACGGGGDSYDPGESTAILCQDGLDNDGDGDIDCDDSDCAGFVFCAPETEDTAAACADGQDNDGDGDTDCEDSDCQGFVFCLGAGSELDAVTCQDGLDNDDDGLTDCDDPGCQGFTFCGGGQAESSAEDCQDGADNDDDGLTDCDDPGCQGYTFCLPGVENTPTACQDGLDNDGDGLTDCDDAGCKGFTFCSPAAGEGTQATCRDGLDNDRDGKIDCADEDCWVWAFCGHYQGFPVVDAWGETFDGLERPAKTWQEASDICAELGGRLPTVTEIWRNNALDGTGNLSDDTVGNYLWTNIRSYHATPSRAAVALSDGAMTYFAETSTAKFRCVWPDAAGAGFDQARCHGPAGAACWAYDRVWNLDVADRRSLDFVSASNECAFYGASLPSAMEWADMIHEGLEPISVVWYWTADVVSSMDSQYVALVRPDPSIGPNWFPGSPHMSWSQASNGFSYRCLGLARPASFPAASPACAEGCETFTARRSSLVADAVDREPLSLAAAAEDCRAAGGELPRIVEVGELLREGWAFPDDIGRWTSATVWDPAYANEPFPLLFLNQAAGASWYPDGAHLDIAYPVDPHPYRCVYRSAGLSVPVCAANQIVMWNGAVYFCNNSQAGSSGGNANGVQIVDDWDNAWDGLERLPATFESARATCEGLGGRLPYASELWAVRNRPDPGDGSDLLFNPHSTIGNSTDTNPLWTLSTTANSGHRALVRVAGGDSSQDLEGSSHNFRCIWPSSRGDVLGEGNCYGHPEAACFRADGMIADSYDRVALDVAGAIAECRMAGGGLPDYRQFSDLVRAGWPNGTGELLRLADVWFDEWFTGAMAGALAFWIGEGQVDWVPTPLSDWMVFQPNSFLHFRCIHDSRLR